jgi:hypothetical protein
MSDEVPMSDAPKSDKLTLCTPIYVEEPTTLTIRAPNPGSVEPLLFRYDQPPQPALGTHRLEPGIYLLMSAHQLEVTNAGVTTHLLASDKDVPPDPKASLLALVNASPQQVQQFFAIAKGLND